MYVYDLPEDLLRHLIIYLPWRDLINYNGSCKFLYNWGEKNQKIMSKAIRKKEGFMLMKYDILHASDKSSDIYKLKTVLSRKIHRPIKSSWMELKECANRLYLMNYVIGEEMKVWSPIIPTHSFTSTKEHWIASIRCAKMSNGWSNRDFNSISESHNTLAHMIQDLTVMVRNRARDCCSVRVVGSPYKEWDTTPPTPLRALKIVQVYAKKNENTGRYGRNGFKRQKLGKDIHIPTAYIDRNNKTTTKSFHYLQAMKLNKGRDCQVRIGFSLYVNPAKRWEWYIRCVFDRIRIYVS